MHFTSVILRCPTALHEWFAEQLTDGTVEEAMMAVLVDWQKNHLATPDNNAQSFIGSILGKSFIPNLRIGSVKDGVFTTIHMDTEPPGVCEAIPELPPPPLPPSIRQFRVVSRRERIGRRRNKRR